VNLLLKKLYESTVKRRDQIADLDGSPKYVVLSTARLRQ
jgi:hypothetical protein